MLTMREELLEQARKSVNESGYQYKKGRSRSKKFGSESSAELSTPKRPKLDQEFRSKRMQQIKEEIKTINTQVSFKEKRVEAGAQGKNFKLCDQLTEEIADLQMKRRALEMELQGLEKKSKKARWYQKQKASSRNRCLSPLSSDSESSTTLLSPLSSTPPCTPLSLFETPKHSRATSASSSVATSPNPSQQRRSLSTPPQFNSRPEQNSHSTVDLTRRDSGDTVILPADSDAEDTVDLTKRRDSGDTVILPADSDVEDTGEADVLPSSQQSF